MWFKKKPKWQVQAYYNKTDKLFTRGKLQDAKQRKRHIFWLHPKIKKLCVMWDYANMDFMFVGTLKVDQILIELGETPFELLKEEQEDGVAAHAIGEKQVSAIITKVGLIWLECYAFWHGEYNQH